MAVDQGFATYAISFRYGQRHAAELDAARRVAGHLGARRHVIADIDLRSFGGSALTDDIAVPKDQAARTTLGAEIPVTYVPARNTIFLSYALAWAEVLGSSAIYLGVNALDYSGYPDCRPEYVESPTGPWPTWPPRPASRATSSSRVHTPAHRPYQGRHHPGRVGPRCRLRDHP